MVLKVSTTTIEDHQQAILQQWKLHVCWDD